MTVTIGRRELLAALGGAAVAWPLAARAQQPQRTRLVGILMPFPESDAAQQTRFRAFRQELTKLGNRPLLLGLIGSILGWADRKRERSVAEAFS